jgi:hypothetical protein
MENIKRFKRRQEERKMVRGKGRNYEGEGENKENNKKNKYILQFIQNP